MRVLYYNWVDYLDVEKRGGGVTVYQRNLMAAFGAARAGKADFLCSGLSYDPGAKPPRWEVVRHGPDVDRARRFEIINSAVLAPSHHSFGNLAQVTDTDTEQVFFDFIEANGPYDVVHFNNLEGIPARVLQMKKRWPQTRIVLSLHNYYPVCPQVNLWFQESENCSGFAEGAKCVSCLMHKPPERLVRQANALAYRLKLAGIQPGTRTFDVVFRNLIRVGHRLSRLARLGRGTSQGAQINRTEQAQGAAQEAAQKFAQRRREMVALINSCCDRVLCVSDRVGQVAAHHGIRPELLQTSYIGTVEAEKFGETVPHASVLGTDKTLTLAYLGYMRRDKGFFFLLDALEQLPDALVSRLRLVVAARTGPPDAMARLEALRPRLAGLTHVDGYSHDGLDDLLADVGVGLVPVLWEDNLPQVAIEMHARHIPLLTSDLGGAQELSGSAEMRFVAGDVASLGARLSALLDGQVDLDSYWRNAQPPVSMNQHLDALMQVYTQKIPTLS